MLGTGKNDGSMASTANLGLESVLIGLSNLRFQQIGTRNLWTFSTDNEKEDYEGHIRNLYFHMSTPGMGWPPAPKINKERHFTF